MSFSPEPGPDSLGTPEPDAQGVRQDIAPAVPGGSPPGPMAGSLRKFRLHPNFGWAILWCVGVMLFTQITGAALGVGYILLAFLLNIGDIAREPNTQNLLNHPQAQIGIGIALGSAHVLLILVSLLVLRVIVGRDWLREVAVRPPHWVHVVLIVLLTPAFMIIANGVFYVLHEVLHLPTFLDAKKTEGMPDLEQMINSAPLSLAILVIGILPALSEELWCRAFLGRGLVGIHGYVAGVLMTSFLFGLIHVDPCQGIMAAVVGVVLHYLYLTTRSLIAPMIMHFLNNSASVLLTRFARGDLVGEGEKLPVFVYEAAGLMLVAIGYALYQSRARLVAAEGEEAWKPPHQGVACPPSGSGTVVVTPLPSLASLGGVGLAFAVFAGAMALALLK